VPIPETRLTRPGLATSYDAIRPALGEFQVELPGHLTDARTHLDPDFEHLTYGDRGSKGRQLVRHLSQGDLVVYYAGLRDIVTQRLGYAIIGLFVVDDIVPIDRIGPGEFARNAHTRREPREEADDVIVIGKPGQSGRATQCISIGEYRSGAYRVMKPLLTAWGDLSVKDGYLQRSAVFPLLLNAAAFWRWWKMQNVELVRRNN
jgi:hypothetical protein